MKLGLGDILFIVFLPPFASGVRAGGCGMMFLVFLLWCCAWVPGSVVAFWLQVKHNERLQNTPDA